MRFTKLVTRCYRLISPIAHMFITLSYTDPINESYEATGAMYERVIDTAIQESTVRSKGKVAVMAATHNEDTVRYCVQRCVTEHAQWRS